MEIRRGIPVSPGIVIRQAFVLDSEDYRIPRRFVTDKEIEGEVGRFKDAVGAAEKEINNLKQDLLRKGSAEVVPIFEAHLHMLLDRQMHDDVISQVRNSGFTAEYAVSKVFRTFSKSLKAIKDPFFAERVVDFYDIQKRLQRTLLGARREDLSHLSEEVVLVAHELTPSQIATLDRSKVLGIALDAGGRTSHTSIMARALGIPSVVGLETVSTDVSGGQTVIIDGNRGVVIVEPDETTLRKYQDAEGKYHEFSRSLLKFRHLSAKTTDGVKISLLANIEFPWEIKGAVENGASGIGLYRTEFLYTDPKKALTEDEHYATYKKAMEEVDGRELVIRTMDIGADKFAELGAGGRALEKNPFLGCRSIRLCLENPDTFKVQLRALLRASALGNNLKIMFPMISSLEELRQAKLILADTRESLEKDGIPYNKNIQVGVMIEIPSAAVVADLIAPEVDFFSIGTNDLIQYALAVDRGNERIASLYKPAHPAVLRLINNIVKAGRSAGVKVAMCGEMSGDVFFTILLVGLGLQELSTAPSVIPEIKQIIRSISAKEAKQVARRALKFQTSEEVVDYLIEKTRRILPEVY
jgi:phosphotransferase system enzyme I (PtsI)